MAYDEKEVELSEERKQEIIQNCDAKMEAIVCPKDNINKVMFYLEGLNFYLFSRGKTYEILDMPFPSGHIFLPNHRFERQIGLELAMMRKYASKAIVNYQGKEESEIQRSMIIGTSRMQVHEMFFEVGINELIEYDIPEMTAEFKKLLPEIEKNVSVKLNPPVPDSDEEIFIEKFLELAKKELVVDFAFTTESGYLCSYFERSSDGDGEFNIYSIPEKGIEYAHGKIDMEFVYDLEPLDGGIIEVNGSPDEVLTQAAEMIFETVSVMKKTQEIKSSLTEVEKPMFEAEVITKP